MGRRDSRSSRSQSRPSAPKQGSVGGAGQGSPAGPRAAAPSPPPLPKVIELPQVMSVRDLARALRANPIDVIKELMANGIVASINQTIDYETAEIVAGELGFETRPLEAQTSEEPLDKPEVSATLWDRLIEREPPESLKPRPPVVTVLGHVDHGKTTLLDAIRHANVVGDEYGGITQHIGAYQVEHGGRKITFLDTPGHEAFTAMRARGAQVTDLAILVVAADDGIMPQTREAIDHARAANVPILIALNKMDKPSARPDRVKQQLADVGLAVEEWGGDVICVQVSALQQQGIDDLLENILLVTELAELRSNPDRPAVGTVIEGQLDKQRGPTATLLVQAGTLRVGDALVIGAISGRVRAMYDYRGETVSEAPPAMPVLVMGLSDVPTAGDVFREVSSEREARLLAEDEAERQRLATDRPSTRPTISLDDIFGRLQAGEVQELNLVLKADVQGSLEPIVNSIERLGGEDQEVKILHQGIGRITESDIMLASASDAIVIGFHVDVDEAARRVAAQEGVDIRLYNIIYKLIEDVDKALRGMLEPVYEKVVSGHAEVRAVFRIRRRGNIAGCYMTDGVVTRNSWVRVLRDEEELFDGRIDSLKRFQEDVPEVRAGFECGIGVSGWDDFEEGDILEFYQEERVS